LVGPAGANIPEIRIVRTPANTVAQAPIDMTEMTNAPGWYTFTFPAVDGEEYVWIADGDPAAIGQVLATSRFVPGVISGTTVERIEVDIPAIPAAVWDRVLTGATHNIATSAGKRLRELSDFGVRDEGKAQAGGATSITLAATAPSLDDVLIGALVAIGGGLGADQVRVIVDYDGTTKVATVDRAWLVNPDATSDYVVGLAADAIPVADTFNVIRDAVLSDGTRFPGASIAAAVAYLGAVLGTPVVSTPTTVTAGGFTWSVLIVGSTITVTRLT